MNEKPTKPEERRWPERDDVSDLVRRIREISEHCARLPVFDPRTPDEIIGYDENGIW